METGNYFVGHYQRARRRRLIAVNHMTAHDAGYVLQRNVDESALSRPRNRAGVEAGGVMRSVSSNSQNGNVADRHVFSEVMAIKIGLHNLCPDNIKIGHHA